MGVFVRYSGNSAMCHDGRQEEMEAQLATEDFTPIILIKKKVSSTTNKSSLIPLCTEDFFFFFLSATVSL